MAQLSSQSIKFLCLGSDPMIFPFRQDSVKIRGMSAGLSSASYDVRIAHDLTLGVNPANIISKYIMEYVEDGDRRWMRELQRSLKENPSMSALAATMERFSIPANVCGYVCDKSSYARVFVTAFNTLFDPGFRGTGTLELVNLGNEPVEYKAGDPVCQFTFHWLDETTINPYQGKYQDQEEGPQPARKYEG
jgi:dCTP deaminase